MLALCAALWSLSSPAEACSCSAPSIEIYPKANQVVPTNTNIFVFDGPGSVTKPKSEIKLKADGKSISFSAEEFTSQKLHGFVLTLKKALPVKSKITVTIRTKTHIFYTSSDPDTATPELRDITASYHPAKAAISGKCSSGLAYTELEPDTFVEKGEYQKDPSETGFSERDYVLFKVWIVEGKAKIDSSKKPSFYEAGYPSQFQMSTSSICGVNNFDLSAVKGDTITVGVAVIDLSGNQSKVIEKEISLK
jgi:hypothetical protein